MSTKRLFPATAGAVYNSKGVYSIMKQQEATLKTKQALAAALKEKMLKKSFSKISVSELIDASNINRKTFYYHFEDIYALLKWTFEQDAIENGTKKLGISVSEDFMHFLAKFYAEAFAGMILSMLQGITHYK